MNWISRLNKAKKENDRLKKDLGVAKDVLRIEGENKILNAQFGLMETVQNKLVDAEIKGLRQGLKKTLPEVTKSRMESGEKQMTGYLQTVRARALSPSK